jgi:hypothetical protein
MLFVVALVVFAPWTSVRRVVCSHWSPSYRVDPLKRIRGSYYHVNRSTISSQPQWAIGRGAKTEGEMTIQ